MKIVKIAVLIIRYKILFLNFKNSIDKWFFVVYI